MLNRFLKPLVIVVLLFCPANHLPAQEPQPALADPAQIKLDKRFAELLSGATFVGRYTDSNQPVGAVPKEDRYTITKVSKIQGDLWLFQVRIQFGERDVTVPLPLRVLWAGQTPVITVDNVGVPGIGSYSARVLIHGKQYSGTWSGKDHGGHLFGRIETNEKEDAPEEDSETKRPTKSR